jgi:putative ABC transport system permease protein
VKAIDRKLLRDLWQMRSQVVTVALVVGECVLRLRRLVRDHYSPRAGARGLLRIGALGQVFADIKRAPRARSRRRIAAIPA